MKKYLLLAILILLISCSDDDGEKTYNYFPKTNTFYKLFENSGSVILDVEFSRWDEKFDVPNEKGNLVTKGDKFFDITIKRDEEIYEMFYIYCDEDNGSHIITLSIEGKYFGTGIIYDTDKPINEIKDILIINDGTGQSIILKFELEKGITGIYFDEYKFEK